MSDGWMDRLYPDRKTDSVTVRKTDGQIDRERYQDRTIDRWTET